MNNYPKIFYKNTCAPSAFIQLGFGIRRVVLYFTNPEYRILDLAAIPAAS
jgi:hypothetical protein